MDLLVAVPQLVAGALFAAAALICLGFCLAMAYEAVAVAFGFVPTISAITSGQVRRHPVWSRVLFLAAGILIGALAVHFGGWQ